MVNNGKEQLTAIRLFQLLLTAFLSVKMLELKVCMKPSFFFHKPCDYKGTSKSAWKNQSLILSTCISGLQKVEVAGAVAWQVKPLPAMLAFHVGASLCLSYSTSVQLPVNGLQKGNGPTCLGPCHSHR